MNSGSGVEGGEKVPEGYAGADGDVEGVFCAELGYFQTDVGCVDYVGIHAMNLMSGDNGVFFTGNGTEVVEPYAFLDLLEDTDLESATMQLADTFHRVGEIFPSDRHFGSEGGFVYFGRGGDGGYSAEHYGIDQKSVGCAEDGPYVVERTDIVKHYHQRQFLPPAILLDRIAVEVPDGLLFHSGRLSVDDGESGVFVQAFRHEDSFGGLVVLEKSSHDSGQGES